MNDDDDDDDVHVVHVVHGQPPVAAQDSVRSVEQQQQQQQRQQQQQQRPTQPAAGLDDNENDDDDDDGDGEEDDGGADATYADDGDGDGDVSMFASTGMSGRRGRGKYLKPKPLNEVLTRVITALIKRDIYGFFTEPVDLEEVPTYTAVIKDPLDLNTIQDRVSNEEYTNVPPFTADVELVFRNAKTFNAPDTIYFAEAERLETWFKKKIALEGPSAILPDALPTSQRKKKGKAKASAKAVKQEDGDDDDDDINDESGNEDPRNRATASAAGSQRGTRTASPEAGRPPNKRRKLNAADEPSARISLAALLSTSGSSVGLPGPNTAFAKAVAAASVIQARWRVATAAASHCAQREAHFPLRPQLEPNLLRPLIEQTQQLAGSDPYGPLAAPPPEAGDDALPPVNPLQAMRKLTYHADGSVKVPGYTTIAQGWPDTSEAFAMNLLPPSNALHAQLGLPPAPPRVQALFPVLPLPAPPDAVTTATGRALPVPLTVGGTSALNSGTNLSSASFAAAQQTPYTSSGNPFPNARSESAILRPGSTAAMLLPHPVPLNTTFSHEVGMRTNGGQASFGPGQGADGGPWTIPSGGPANDPETSAFQRLYKEKEMEEEGGGGGGDGGSAGDVTGEWWDTSRRKESALPARWALPGMVPYSSGVSGSTHAAGGATPGQPNGSGTPASPSTPARGLPMTPLGLGLGPNLTRHGSPSSPAPSATTSQQQQQQQPSTPLAAAPTASMSTAQGWAQRASKGREKERERESDLRDWTITRPVLERALAFEDVGSGVWAEVRARAARGAHAYMLRTIEETRARIITLSGRLNVSHGAGRAEEVRRLTAEVQALRSIIVGLDPLLPHAAAASGGEGPSSLAQEEVGGTSEGRFLGRYDLVEGESLLKMLEFALRTERADRLSARLAELKAHAKRVGQPVEPPAETEVLTKRDVQTLVDDVQQGVWGGPLGEAYASSVARFVAGAKRSVDEWADTATEGVAQASASGREHGEEQDVVNGPEETGLWDDAIPPTKRDYNDEDYLGGGLRVLLVPPREEVERSAEGETGNAQEDAAKDSRTRNGGAAPTLHTEGRSARSKSASVPEPHSGSSDRATASDASVIEDGSATAAHQQVPRASVRIERDARALEDIVRDDILDPLSGGMLKLVQLVGQTAQETRDMLDRVDVGVQM